MIREISGRGLVPKKTAAKNEKVKKAQEIMIKIVEAYTQLIGINPEQGDANDLKSPGPIDGIWGDNTNNSYKSILRRFHSFQETSDHSPKNIVEAINDLNEILASLKGQIKAAEEEYSETEKGNEDSKPAAAITDDQAKAGFRGLLESIQSGRIKLKAGGDNSVLKQRISRDWGAIIRAYNGPQGVVDAFYEGLALTDPQKAQLVNINKDGFDGTSDVVGKINQKFLEAINAYIKPFGRALRTERSVARVIKRRQERQERKQNRANAALKDLWILSKVAQRKEVARERLEKTAALILIPTALASVAAMIGVTAGTLYVAYNALAAGVNNFDQFFSRNNMNKREFDEKIGEKLFEKTMRMSLDDWLKKNDSESQRPVAFLNQNYIEAAQAWVKKVHELNEQSLKEEKNKNMYTYEQFKAFPGFEYFKKVMGMDIFEWVRRTHGDDVAKKISENYDEASRFNFEGARMAYLKANQLRNESASTEASRPDSPVSTSRRPTTDLTTLRGLLTTAGYPPGPGPGWTPLEAPFRAAVEEFARSFDTKKVLYEEWKWSEVAQSTFGMDPNISGAEALVTKLINLKKSRGGQALVSEPAAPAATPGKTPVDNTTGAKAKLTQLFNMILSGSTKVDRVGIDLRNDTKIFKGVIRGLGGVSQAVEYVFSKVPFTSEQLAELTNMSFDSNQKIAINALSPVRNLFVNIRKVSTDGIGRDRRGLTEDSLARSVTRWLGEQTATPAAKAAASIRKSIEIRKMAARKKLGF